MAPQDYAYVDLNSIIYSNVNLLAEWKNKFDRKEHEIQFYDTFAEKILDSIENVGINVIPLEEHYELYSLS